MRRGGEGCTPRIDDELRQPRRDTVVHARVVGILAHDERIAADPRRLDAVVHRHVGCEAVAEPQLQTLPPRQAGIERGRRQHQGVHAVAPVGHMPRRHRPAHAVAEQHQRARHVLVAQRAQHERQVVEQAGRGGDRAACAFGGAMAALIPRLHRPAGRAQVGGQAHIALGVLAQAVHDEHGAAHGAPGRDAGRPGHALQAQAVGGVQGVVVVHGCTLALRAVPPSGTPRPLRSGRAGTLIAART